MYATLNQCQPGTLLSNTIQNSKNDSHYLSFTTQRSKANTDPLIYVVDDTKNDPVDINDVDKDEIEKLVMNKQRSQKPIVLEKRANTIKAKGKEVTSLLNPIPRPFLPFPQRLKKKAKKTLEDYYILKELIATSLI